MIYAFRETSHSRMLVEFISPKALADHIALNAPRDGGVQPVTFIRTTREKAHAWVKRGNIHETGLWIDQGRIRYS